MTLLEDLKKFQESRKMKGWEPKPSTTKYEYGSSLTTTEEVMLRCLDFVDLEERVGLWLSDFTYGTDTIEREVEFILLENVADELKHDEAIRNLRDYYSYKFRQDTEHAQESIDITESWHRLRVHPVSNAYALEMGVFFTILPIMMKFGDTYACAVAGWINDDERVHVETNLRLMKHLKLKLTVEQVQLVRKTVEYLYKPMGQEIAVQQGTRAVKRLITTKDPAMITESLPQTISYFEQKSNQAIVY